MFREAACSSYPPPYLGNSSCHVDLVDAAAQAPCLFGLSATTLTQSLGGGCTLYLANPVTLFFGVTSAQGFATVGLTIPAAPALRGLVVHTQAAVIDAAGPFGGLAFTAGRQLVLGD